jgi:formylglycine-generating enzyme required for sulfatase activity
MQMDRVKRQWTVGRPVDGRKAYLGLLAIAMLLAVACDDLLDASPGETFKDCAECPVMVVIPSGSFLMGDLSGGGNRDEKPVHRVTIGYSFAVGKYEVTFAEWDACVAAGGCRGYRPSDRSWGRGRRAVINVSWVDAQVYVNWLNKKLGLTSGQDRYRLLSEAEWEFVARAGTETRWSCGNSESCLSDVAWYGVNSVSIGIEH